MRKIAFSDQILPVDYLLSVRTSIQAGKLISGGELLRMIEQCTGRLLPENVRSIVRLALIARDLEVSSSAPLRRKRVLFPLLTKQPPEASAPWYQLRNDYAHRAAVVIEPVSAHSLSKTGIFAEKAGDFRRFPPPPLQTGKPETKAKARKTRISGPFSRLLGSPAERRTAWLATQC